MHPALARETVLLAVLLRLVVLFAILVDLVLPLAMRDRLLMLLLAVAGALTVGVELLELRLARLRAVLPFGVRLPALLPLLLRPILHLDISDCWASVRGKLQAR